MLRRYVEIAMVVAMAVVWQAMPCLGGSSVVTSASVLSRPLRGFAMAPDGLLHHSDCVHHDVAAVVELQQDAQCHSKSHRANQVPALFFSDLLAGANALPANDDDELVQLSSQWVVPLPPDELWYAQTLVVFNQLRTAEVQGKATVTLQTLVFFGRNACGGGFVWTLATLVIARSGHVYCGPLATVQPGHTVTASMTYTADGSGKGGMWAVTATARNEGDVVATSTLRARVADHIESGMSLRRGRLGVLSSATVECGQLPANGAVEFSDVDVASREGPAPLTRDLRHSFCDTNVTVTPSRVALNFTAQSDTSKDSFVEWM